MSAMRAGRTRTVIIVALAAFAAGWLLHRATGPGRPPTEALDVPPGAFEALCVRVIDGDTIELLSGERVRYIGSHTPERRPGEAWAEAATEANRELVEQKMVRLEPDVQERDRYGRLLAYVYVDGLLVNEELVRLGYARVSTYPPNVRHEATFLAAEREARASGRGLWATESDEGA